MKFNIYCKKTDELLAVYSNAKTLETLDTSKCYYIAVEESKPVKRSSSAKSNSKSSFESTKPNNQSGSSSSQNDYMNPLNPLNPVGFHQTIAAVSSDSYSSSSSCSSSSSYSDSSSSCDSSSF